jgi:hypothetical protein
MTNSEFRERIKSICGPGRGYVRCQDHRNGGATSCPRGGAASSNLATQAVG